MRSAARTGVRGRFRTVYEIFGSSGNTLLAQILIGVLLGLIGLTGMVRQGAPTRPNFHHPSASAYSFSNPAEN